MPFPHRNCPMSPDLAPAAERLGIPLSTIASSGLGQVVARHAAGQPLGPGDWLHILILRWFKEQPTQKCGCESRITQMNAWGIEGCREHLEEIVDWLYREACDRGWWKYVAKVPGSKIIIRRMVRKAIAKAETMPSDKQAVAKEIAAAIEPAPDAR